MRQRQGYCATPLDPNRSYESYETRKRSAKPSPASRLFRYRAVGTRQVMSGWVLFRCSVSSAAWTDIWKDELLSTTVNSSPYQMFAINNFVIFVYALNGHYQSDENWVKYLFIASSSRITKYRADQRNLLLQRTVLNYSVL